MKIEVMNIKGESVKSVDLPGSLFGVEMNEPLLHAVCKAYRANRRQGTHATKTRSTVSGSGKKPFRQKGTGNARQGCSRSPLMPGGATSHGPQPRSYRQDLNRKQRKLALKVALSEKVRYSKLVLVDDFAVSNFSTKHIVGALNALKVEGGALLTDERKDKFLYGSARNIHKVGTGHACEINAEDVLRYETLVLSESALESLCKRLGGKE